MQVQFTNQFSNPRLRDEGNRSAPTLRSRAESPRASTMPIAPERGKLTLPWSLLLLGVGYFLLVAGPLWSSRISAGGLLSDSVTGSPWLPAPAAAGLALFGAAALIFVIARLVRDVEQRPYASIAPVLAVFSGFVLTSTRADLGLPGTGSSQLGLLVLTLALLGGVLIGRAGLSERALGWVLALLPTVALFWMIMAVHGVNNPIAMLQRVDTPVCTYLVLLAVSSLAMGAVGAVAPRLLNGASGLHERAEASASLDSLYTPMPMPMPHNQQVEPLAQRAARAVAQHVAYNEQIARTQPASYAVAPLQNSARSEHALRMPVPVPVPVPVVQRRTHAAASSVMRTMPGYAAGQPARGQGARHPGPTSYSAYPEAPTSLRAHVEDPRVSTSELALDDPDLLLLTRRKYPLGRIALAVAALAVVGVALGVAYSYLLPVQGGSGPSELRSRTPDPRASTTGSREGTSDRALPTSPVSPSGQAITPAGQPLPAATAPLATVPTVTPLTPVSAPDVSNSVRADKPSREQRRREHAPRRVRESSASEPKPVAERAPKPALGANPRARAEQPPAATAPSKPVVSAPKPASAPPKSQNSEDLDLDELVEKALRGGKGNVAASDDPILGL